MKREKKAQTPFDPKTTKFPYPEQTDRHYLVVKKNDGTVFDENYPYIDESKRFRRSRFWIRLVLRCLVFFLVYIRLSLKIKGKENLKKYKDVLAKGAVTVSNHVHMWDYLSIMTAMRPRWMRLLVWAPNISGEMGGMIRAVGGIPIPEHNLKASAVCFKTVIDYLNSGGLLQIYPEGSMWEFYQPIRPFKDGAAYFAIKANKPVLPMAFSYRKPNWFKRVILHSPANFTLNIGEPIYPDLSLPYNEASIKLTEQMHDAVCRLAGIDPKENLYPPIFKNSKRVDYYATEYGKGYKGSA